MWQLWLGLFGRGSACLGRFGNGMAVVVRYVHVWPGEVVSGKARQLWNGQVVYGVVRRC